MHEYNILDLEHRGALMDVLDFVERYNKKDEEPVVAESAAILQKMLDADKL